MEIKETSWHYKIYKAMCPYHSLKTNLCKYFWVIVFGMAVGAFICAAVTFILFSIGLLFYTFTLYSFAGLGVLLLVIALVVIRRRRPDAPKAEPGLVRLYLKARKDRICPLVEFVN